MRKRQQSWAAFGLAAAMGLKALGQMGAGTMSEPAGSVAKPHSAPSTSLLVQAGDKTLTLSAADLQAMPHETVIVVNGHSQKNESYSGVTMETLLAKLGMPFIIPNEHTLVRSYLVAQGTDGYAVVVSVYEVLPAVHGGSAIVADTLDGKPLGEDGAFKLVLSSDRRPQRWVRNLTSLRLETVR